MRSYFFGVICFASLFLTAQEKYPHDTFGSPMGIPMVLAGTFGELRSNPCILQEEGKHRTYPFYGLFDIYQMRELLDLLPRHYLGLG